MERPAAALLSTALSAQRSKVARANENPFTIDRQSHLASQTGTTHPPLPPALKYKWPLNRHPGSHLLDMGSLRPAQVALVASKRLD